jgi:ribosome-binding factor A
MDKNFDNRHLQIDELLKREMGDLLVKEVDFPKGCLVTITKVVTDRDIKEADIYISVLPKAFTGKVLSLMRKRSRHFIYILRKKVTIKYIPEIKFIIDEPGEEEEFSF